MHKLRKFFYDNKNKIIKIGAFIIFLFIILQLLNKLVQIKNKKSIENVAASNTTNANTTTQNDNKGLISNKSAVNGSEVSKENLKNATDTIYKFVDYCNKQEIEKAYNLITEECKQQMYPTLDAFKNAYYGDVFNGKQRTCTIENWVGDIYKVRMGEDILSTGKDTGYAKEDYITIKKADNEYKLNINNYIGTTKIEKTTTKDNITMEVLNKNTYKDFEEYTIKVTNKTNGIIKLDTTTSTKTTYIEDSNGRQYSYYNNELTDETLTFQRGQTAEVTIKFYSPYISTKSIKAIVFSNIIFNDNQLSDTIEFRANV